jgi:hypothetical protein
MSNFEQVEALRELNPSIELVDELIQGLYEAHHSPGNRETQWLVPIDHDEHPAKIDELPHIRLDAQKKNWKMLVFQRTLGDNAWHRKSKALVYQRDAHGLYLEDYTIYKSGLLPRASASPAELSQEEIMYEVYERLCTKPLIPKMKAMEQEMKKSHQLTRKEQEAMYHERKALRCGSFAMRQWERMYIGQKPDLGIF